MIFSLIWFAVLVCFWIAVAVILSSILKKSNCRLYKSETNRKLCGVCGGIGEALNVDPTIVRLIWALVTVCGGSGILAYIIAALVLPNQRNMY